MNRSLRNTISLFCVVFLCLSLTALPAFADTYGDADGDGRVSPADARLVLRCAIGLDELSPNTMYYCDIDGDGYITPADARLVLRLAIGLPVDNVPGGAQPQQQEQKPEQTKSTKTQYMEKLIGMVSMAELQDNFQLFTDKVGSRWYESEGMNQGRGWVRGILYYNGFEESEIVQDQFDCKGEKAFNIYTKITTAVPDPDIILFVAHYDSYHTGAGAVDNASGVCTVLEIARILKSLNKDQNVDFGVEIRFLFTAGEEVGYYGAYRYVNHFSPLSLNRHAAVFNVDMSAHFKNSTNHYLCVSTHSANVSNAQPNKASLAVDEAKSLIGSCGEYAYRSPVYAGRHDLIPFEKNQVPGVTLSWREINYNKSYGSQDGLAEPNEIHSSYDVADNVDMDSLYRTTRLAVGAAAALVYDYCGG